MLDAKERLLNDDWHKPARGHKLSVVKGISDRPENVAPSAPETATSTTDVVVVSRCITYRQQQQQVSSMQPQFALKISASSVLSSIFNAALVCYRIQPASSALTNNLPLYNQFVCV